MNENDECDIEMRRQETVGFSTEVDEMSFNDWRQKVAEKAKTQYLRTSIDNEVRHCLKMMNMQSNKSNEGYDFYFNYELNTKTWHQFVNKQIMQTYHRLVIEKQLKEAKKMEKDIKDQIDDMDRKIRHTDNEI